MVQNNMKARGAVNWGSLSGKEVFDPIVSVNKLTPQTPELALKEWPIDYMKRGMLECQSEISLEVAILTVHFLRT